MWGEALPLAGRPARFRLWLNRFDRVIVLSEAGRRMAGATGVEPDRIRVIPLFCPPPAARPPEPPEPPRVLYAGWIQQRKGLHVLIQAWPGVLARLPAARLCIIGETTEPAYAESLRRDALRLGVADSLEWAGRRTRGEVAAEFARAHAVAIPEQWENVSPVILGEALAAGVPVVASRVGGMTELLRDGVNGLAVPPDSPEAFTRALLEILTDPERRRQLADGALETIRRQRNPDDITRTWLSLYRELAAHPAGG